MKNNEKKAMYRGNLVIGNVEVDCFVLDNEQRIILKSSVFKCFGRTSRGLDFQRQNTIKEFLNSKIPENTLQQIPSFLDSKAILSLINKEFLDVLQPIKFIDGEKQLEGFSSEIIPEMCGLYLEARRKMILDRQQIRFADQAEILISSFAKVGINALIDEATGYQYNRKKDALRLLLEQYIEEGLRKWLKTFPDDFFEQLDKLYHNETTSSRQRPLYYGQFINTYIYEPIEKGYVKAELDKKNVKDDGKRKARFHQWLTDFGREKLISQIGFIKGIMSQSINIGDFKQRVENMDYTTSLFPELYQESLI